MTSRLTSKGQATIPKAIRDYMGVKQGSAVDFSLTPEGDVVLRAAEPHKSLGDAHRFDSLRGSLHTGKSTDELMALLRGYDQDADDPGFE